MLAEAVEIQPLIVPQDLQATAIGDIVDLIGDDVQELMLEVMSGAISGTPSVAIKMQDSPAIARGSKQLSVGTVDLPLRNGTNDNIKLAVKFTQSGAASVKTIGLMLKKIGTLAAGKKLTCTICADSTGDPGSVLGTAGLVDIDTELTTDVYDMIEFVFATPVEVADATVYHIVLEGDYTVSASDQVNWRLKTVGSGGNTQIYDSAWGSLVTTQALEYYVEQYTFADVAGMTFAAMAAANLTHRKGVQATDVRRYLRPVLTVTGGSPHMLIAMNAVLWKRRHPVTAQ